MAVERSPFNVAPQKLLRKASGVMTRAVMRALNRTAGTLMTTSVRAIQQDIGARRQKEIRKGLTVDRAKPNKLVAFVRARGAQIPIAALRHRPSTPGYRPSTPGVVWGPDNKLIPSSFPARMETGHLSVFKRFGAKRTMISGSYEGKMREPIIELGGPSIAKVFSNRKIQRILRKIREQRWPIELKSAARDYASRAGIGGLNIGG